MRTLDPVLQDALENQKGELILRVLTWTNKADYDTNPTAPDHLWVVKAFDIQSTSASAELVTENNYTLSDFSVFIIERGVKINGVEYPVQSGLFHVVGYQEDYGAIKITGSSYPKQKISIAGDGTYQEVIDAFCLAIGKTAVFKNATDTWLNYQFLPDGKTLSLNKAEQIENLLKQKYAILVYEESPCSLVFYNQDSYPSSALKAIASDETKLLAVATSGASSGMSSINAADWTPQTLPSFYNDIAYSPSLSLWVAVGASVCGTSADGITWTARTIPAGLYNSIAWSASLSLFVAIGDSICATSANGIAWTARTIPAGDWSSITVNNNIFMVIGENICAISPNGTNWENLLDDQTVARYATSISLLSDGRVLIIAGRDIAGINRAETYFGTISGNITTWASGTNLPAARESHATTILADGRILVTGGYNTANQAETYFGTISGNVITWASGTNLPTARQRHTANILPDGRLLITGGYNIAETYFGTISGNVITWASGTNLPTARYNHTANILPDGRILITGGNNTAETYFGTISGNVITWASGTNLPTARYEHTANILADGRILITGGNNTAETYFGTISGNVITWASGTNLPTARYSHTLAMLNNTKLIVTQRSGTTSKIGVISGNTISWINNIPTGSYNSIIWSNSLNLFLAIGTDVYSTSPENNINWTARTIPAGTYNGIAYGNSLFVAVGASIVATSPDGINWTARTPAALNNWQDVLWISSLALFVAVASDGKKRVMFSADGINWQASTANADYDLSYQDGVTSYLVRDQSAVHYLWRDETASLHTAGDTTLPQWNLGFLASTDSPPITREDAYYKIYLKKAPVRLDLTDGDKIHFTPYWSIDPTKTIDAMMQVSEHLNLTKSPAWYQEIKSIIMFNSTEGGALPSTIERVAAYTPLVSTGFDGNLTPAVNNLQALAQAVDDMTVGSGYTPPATTAENDIQVGSGAGAWIKKTLAEFKTILGLSYSYVIGSYLSNTAVPASTTYYARPFGAGVDAYGYQVPWPEAGVLSNMTVRLSGAQPASGSLVFTLYINGSATALVLTIAAGTAAFTTIAGSTHKITINAEDRITWNVVNNATATSGTLVSINMRLTKTTT